MKRVIIVIMLICCAAMVGCKGKVKEEFQDKNIYTEAAEIETNPQAITSDTIENEVNDPTVPTQETEVNETEVNENILDNENWDTEEMEGTLGENEFPIK